MLHLCLVTIGLCGLFVLTLKLQLFPADLLSQYKTMPYHLGIMFWGACFRVAYDNPSQVLRVRLAGSGVLSRLSLTYRSAVACVTIPVVGIALAGPSRIGDTTTRSIFLFRSLT